MRKALKRTSEQRTWTIQKKQCFEILTSRGRKQWNSAVCVEDCPRGNICCMAMRSVGVCLLVNSRWWMIFFPINLNSCLSSTISGRPLSAMHFSLSWRCVLFNILTKDERKVNSFFKKKKLWESSGPCLPLWTIPKSTVAWRPHAGFGYYSCFVSCLFV